QVPKYLASTQLSTGFTMTDQVHLKEEWFSPRDADIKFSNLLSSMHSGAPTNFLSYRLLLHDLDPTNVPFHRPAADKFQATPDEISYVKDLVTEMLAGMLPLSTSSPGYSQIRKFLTAYNYDYLAIKSSMSIYRIPNTDYIQVDYISDNPQLS